VSILWLRAQAPLGGTTLVAHVPAQASLASPGASGQGDSYVVPRPKPAAALVPSTELANYVVAHSMFSNPVARGNLLSAFMTSEAPASGTEEPQSDVKALAH